MIRLNKKINILTFAIFTLLILKFMFSINLPELFLLIVITLLLMSIIILNDKRKNELNEIKEVIKKIRSNQIKNLNEIKLSNSLKNLEEEIVLTLNSWNNIIENLKKLEQVRTEFLGNVSHELRTPIFTIQGYLETLLDGAIDDENVNRIFLKKAMNHTNNLNTLLNDLIDISMIESGQMRMSFRYFNIHEFLKNFINDYKQQAETKGLKLFLHSFNEKLELFGDKNRLKQVMNNLITNAIKYTEKGSVEIGVIEEGNNAIIYVQDTGIGISQEDLPRIFERFYRVDKDRSRELGGTGLGLAIVKHILEAHDSKIHVESKLNSGSKFYFRLKK